MSDHEPVPHVDRDGSECLSMAQHFGIAQDVWDRGIEEIRARMEREHERGLAAYVPEDEADEVERLRAEVETWRARYEVADDEAKAAEAALARVGALADQIEARAAMNRQAAENHQHDPKRTSFVMVSRAHASELDQQAAALRAALRGPDAEVTE